MPRAIDKLSALTVARSREPGRYGDGGGLYLVVDSSGARRWLMIFRHGGRQREMGLGSAGIVTLADARRKRDEVRRSLADGRDPIAERRSAKAAPARAVTFGAFTDALVPELVKGFRNTKHAAQWTSTLATYAAPLRSKPLAEITTDDVLAVLQPIWTTKTETASRVRGRIEHILDAARTRGLRTGENPARWRGNLQHLLPKRSKLTRGHHRAMPYEDVPAFVAELRARKAVSSLALELLILTAARVGELVGMKWDEIDLAAKLWTVPGARMKAERDHRVPLCERAMTILGERAKFRRGPFVFDGVRADKPMSTGVFDALLERMKVPYTAHGFRSSFRDWAGDCTDFPREVAEAALAHSVGDKAEQAYRRGDALRKRRQITEAWEGYIGAGCQSPVERTRAFNQSCD